MCPVCILRVNAAIFFPKMAVSHAALECTECHFLVNVAREARTLPYTLSVSEC